MKSDLPKPIVPLDGKPLVQHLIDQFQEAGINQIAMIIGYKADKVKETLGQNILYIEQAEQKGTAHAVLQAKNKIEWTGKDIFVFVGDSPLITSHTIRELLAYHRLTNADCSFLTSEFKIKLPYARVIKDDQGNLVRCVEEKNASPEELEVTELLSSHFIFKAESLFDHLGEIQPDPENQEYYLTDILDIFLRKGLRVETLHIERFEELVGLNTPDDVAWAEEILNQRAHAKG